MFYVFLASISGHIIFIFTVEEPMPDEGFEVKEINVPLTDFSKVLAHIT